MNATLKKFIIITLVSSIVVAIVWYIFKKYKEKYNQNQSALKGGKNNPGHLRFTNTPWHGKIYPKEGEKFIFESFDTMENGIRAWLINARTQINKGYNTIDKFIDRLTPASENPESARNGMKNEIRTVLQKENIEVKDLPKIAPIIFRWEGNKDFLAVKNEYGPLRIQGIANKYNIV